MERQPGYISTRLHRSLVPNARFRFINVAEWATVEHFQAALHHPEFMKLRDAVRGNLPMRCSQPVTLYPDRHIIRALQVHHRTQRREITLYI